jgi:hypothetical protein
MALGIIGVIVLSSILCILGFHKWKYWTPSNRHCKRCAIKQEYTWVNMISSHDKGWVTYD